MPNLEPIKDTIASDAGKEFAIEVMDFMRERMMDYQNDTNHLYNLAATPAEGVTRRLSRMDIEKYPDIIVANNEAVKSGQASPYYTYSTQLPVNYTDDLFEAMDLQDDIQTRYTGGTVLHAILGEALPSAEAANKIVKKVAYKYHLPYFTLTPTFSICPKHGYLVGEHRHCPKCDQEIGYIEKKEEEISTISTETERDLISAMA